MILLNPGPVTLSPGVRAALQGEDLCHREPEFATLTLALRRAIEQVYAQSDAYTAVLLTASGSGAVEAMLSTFCGRERTTVVAANGVYGERMAAMLQRQGKPCALVQGAWDAAPDLAAIAAALDSNPGAESLAVVHHETTTGRLNDLGPIAALCRARGVALLVDAVSSFGGEAIDLAAWQPLAVAATANKCLHGVPGVSFVLARTARLQAPRGLAPTLYLDLEPYFAAQADGWSPFTQAVQGFQALGAALREFEAEGGWAARRQRYAARSATVAACLARHGVQALLAPGESASMLRAYRLPQGLDYARLHDPLKAAGFTIYAGQGRLASGIFRIATMGSIGDADLARLVAALDAVLGQRP